MLLRGLDNEAVRFGKLANVTGRMGIAQAGLQHEVVLVGRRLDRETEQTAGPQDARHAVEHTFQRADIDENIGGDDQVVAPVGGSR